MSICADYGNEFQLLGQDNATEMFYDSYLKLQSVSMIFSEIHQMIYHLNLCQFQDEITGIAHDFNTLIRSCKYVRTQEHPACEKLTDNPVKVVSPR